MDKITVIIKVLEAHPCLTSKEISAFARRMFGEEITPGSVSGSIRKLISEGKAGKSKHPDKGTMVYWLNEEI